MYLIIFSTFSVPKIFDKVFNLFKPVIRMTSLERVFIADKGRCLI